MGELIFQRAEGGPERFNLGQQPLTIGRGAAAGIQIYDEFISRTHCELSLREGQVVLRDLNSHNGTHVNGQRIQEAKLKSADKITLGLTELVVRLQEKTVPSTQIGAPPTRDMDMNLQIVPAATPQAVPANTVRIELPPMPPRQS